MNRLPSAKSPAGPIIKPIAFWQIDIPFCGPLIEDRSHQQIVAEQKFHHPFAADTFIIRDIPETSGRMAGTPVSLACLHGIVNIGQQDIAQFNGLPVDQFILIAKSPRFLVGRTQGGMSAHKRIKYPGLQPTGKQLAGRRAGSKPPISLADKRKSRQAPDQAEWKSIAGAKTTRTYCLPAIPRHTSARPQNLPGSGQKADLLGVTVTTLQTSTGSAIDHKHCEDFSRWVVDCPSLSKTDQGHRPTRHVKNRRLIHVVPNTSHAQSLKNHEYSEPHHSRAAGCCNRGRRWGRDSSPPGTARPVLRKRNRQGF